MPAILFFVVPCYYDEDVLPITAPVMIKKLDDLTHKGAISTDSRILFVNDGSTDETWKAIQKLHGNDARIIGIDLAENVGEQNALLAGMEYAVSLGAECVVTMDSDLQDDIDAVDKMLEKYADGSEMVLGVHGSRKYDPFMERFFSGAFYTLMKASGTGLIKEHANYRLLSRKAINALFEKVNGQFYLPAVVCGIDLPYSVVEHIRFPRAAGESGYSFNKKLKLAINAFFRHTKTPITSAVRKISGGSGSKPVYSIKDQC